MMKRISFLALGLTLLSLLSGCKAQTEPQPDADAALRYDGLYCYIMDFDGDGLTNNYALRFYEDGTVIHASVEQKTPEGTYFPTGGWFSKENEDYADLLGSYELEEGRITLTTKDENGTVTYQGVVQSDKLILDSHADFNGRAVKNSEYIFYPFDLTA